MEVKDKELYEAPAIQSIEVKQEGVICASDPNYRGLGSEEDM